MAAIDFPLGGGAPPSPHEFAAPPWSRRLSWLAFAFSWVVIFSLGRSALLVTNIQAALALFLMMVCGMAFVVRSARLHVAASGVRWGWRSVGFRMDLSRIAEIHAYRNAVMVKPTRRGRWYLVARDWQHFDKMVAEMGRLGLPFHHHQEKAPLMATLQGYGLTLDAIVLASAAGLAWIWVL